MYGVLVFLANCSCDLLCVSKSLIARKQLALIATKFLNLASQIQHKYFPKKGKKKMTAAIADEMRVSILCLTVISFSPLLKQCHATTGRPRLFDSAISHETVSMDCSAVAS